MDPADTSPETSLVGIATIARMLQRSRASIYRDIASGRFPKPLKLGASSRWLRSEVLAYIDELAGSRGDLHGDCFAMPGTTDTAKHGARREDDAAGKGSGEAEFGAERVASVRVRAS